jgi:hypothetical protein
MNDLTEFLERYRATWEDVLAGAEDISDLASFFHVPCMTVDPNGAVSWIADAASIDTFLQSRHDAFRAGGVVRPLSWGIEAHTLGPRAAVASLNWELHRGDGSVERTYRICYGVVRVADDWKFLLLTYQSGM